MNKSTQSQNLEESSEVIFLPKTGPISPSKVFLTRINLVHLYGTNYLDTLEKIRSKP